MHTIHNLLLQPCETATITLCCIAKHHSNNYKQQTIFSCSICAPLEIIMAAIRRKTVYSYVLQAACIRAMQAYIIALLATIAVISLLSVVDCGSPPPSGNGSPGVPTPDTTYQGTVRYTCDSGYEVSNGITTATATCMANGMWDTVPTCSRM